MTKSVNRKHLFVSLVLAFVMAGSLSASVTEQGWVLTGRLNAARESHTATLLSTGEVLVAGGFGAGTGTCEIIGSAEVFDPVAATWRPTGSLNTARYDHTATLLPSGEVLVVGGHAADKDCSLITGTAELYNPSTGRWRATGGLITPRFSHSATLLKNGKLLVTG